MAPKAAAGDTLGPAVGPGPVPVQVPVLPLPLPPLAQDTLPARRATRAENVVGGGQDRMHHLAMVPGSTVPPLRMRTPGRTNTLGPARPGSRVECMRRCGSDGFCDPSSPSGCGGEYCLAGRDLV